MFIECARGTASGRACFYLRSVDADTVFLQTSVDLKARLYVRDSNDVMKLTETVTFKEYYPCERSEVDEWGNVYVTLRDKRSLLESATISQRFNQVFLVALTTAYSRTLHTLYIPAYCLASNVPHTFAQIMAAVFAPSTLSPPALPISAPLADNVYANGTCADVLSGMLASIGCDLVLDPFTGTLSIVELSGTQSFPLLASVNPIANNTQSLKASERVGEVVAVPQDYFPVRPVQPITGTFGTGTRSINVFDHQLADETTSQVSASRMTQIKIAVQDWYRAENARRDETYTTIIPQVPGAQLRSVRWEVFDAATIAVNDAVPMPWITPTGHWYQAGLIGKTLAGGMTANTATRCTLYLRSGGAWAITVLEVDAIAKEDIDGIKEVKLLQVDDKWVAIPIPCSEKLEKFTMLSGWSGTNATAAFTLIEEAIADEWGTLEDPLGIFTDQIGYGHAGLSIRTCDNRHFVIQAKCNQTPITPPTLGQCLYGTPGSLHCAQTTEANCTLLGGVWTAATACP